MSDRALGVVDGHQCGIYDGSGLCSAARRVVVFRLDGRKMWPADVACPKDVAEAAPTGRTLPRSRATVT